MKAPAGSATRPTSDRVREALFSILESRVGNLEGIEVLDLFAGSGALGLEALSRGAARAVFVDQSVSCQRTISDNGARLGFADRCSVLAMKVLPALLFLARKGYSFPLILADPPYREDPDPWIKELSHQNLLQEDGIFVLEHGSFVQPKTELDNLVLTMKRRYGDTHLSLYQRKTVSIDPSP
jgi:16S rRNA (guanine966-N2)-methyltransferase